VVVTDGETLPSEGQNVTCRFEQGSGGGRRAAPCGRC
jgi:hypothetical protein